MINLSLQEAIAFSKPLGLFVLGMAIYAVFVFKFYRFLSRKDLFEMNLEKYNKASHSIIRKFLRLILYLLKYVIIFPVCLFFWFIVLTTLLSLLARNQTTESILLVSIAVVGAVRVTAYYNEDLSKDLAKMLPFALLGVFLVDMSYFTIKSAFNTLWEVTFKIELTFYYLIFVIVLEFVLRILTSIISLFKKDQEAEEISKT